MYYRLMNLLLLLSATYVSFAQQLPEVGAKLNYTQIMFEHPKVYGADEYVVQVALADEDGLFEHPVAMQKDSATAVMLSNFEFGGRYIWRYAGLHSGKELGWNGPYNFEILGNMYADKNYYQVMVLKPDSEEKTDGLIILDEIRTIVDRNGNFVWFLPETRRTRTPEGEINDLRLTPAGTFTYIEGRRAFETDLSGKPLWAAPSDSSIVIGLGNNRIPQYSYNHCFMRLPNGNYMAQSKINEPAPGGVKGAEPVQVLPTSMQGAPTLQPAGEPMSKPVPVFAAANATSTMQYDIIREFDKHSNVVWRWNSKDYFNAAEEKAMLEDRPDSGILSREPGGHLNAFSLSNDNRYVYAGFRNISRVAKIDIKTGKVVHSWGTKIPGGGADEGDGFFSKQHDVSLLNDGSVAVFSNGSISGIKNKDADPSAVVLFSQPVDGTKSKVVWKYDCIFDSVLCHSIRGGNVNELKNGNLLVCMGSVNRIFEVTRSRQIVWQAEIVKYIESLSLWTPKSLYRIHYASSLYPCYYTAETNKDTLTQNSSSFSIRIFNTGSENDSYTVRVTSPAGSYRKYLKAVPVNSGRSATVNIAPGKTPHNGEKINVSVISDTNPDMKRTMVLQFIPGTDKGKH